MPDSCVCLQCVCVLRAAHQQRAAGVRSKQSELVLTHTPAGARGGGGCATKDSRCCGWAAARPAPRVEGGGTAGAHPHVPPPPLLLSPPYPHPLCGCCAGASLSTPRRRQGAPCFPPATAVAATAAAAGSKMHKYRLTGKKVRRMAALAARCCAVHGHARPPSARPPTTCRAKAPSLRCGVLAATRGVAVCSPHSGRSPTRAPRPASPSLAGATRAVHQER